MCGICGIIDFGGEAIQPSLIEKMTDAIRHRGPDGAGVNVDGPAGFGHARLSIIDLSSAGHQPMRSDDGSVTIAFNGEVYNFELLRAQLEAEGVRFYSRTDTEVVLQAYRRWGRDSFSRLSGMFAFAVWDARDKTVYLVRDRFGIKPLYYYVTATGKVVFGSEIKSILASGMVERDISPAGLHEYLWFGNALGENTLFCGVRKLLPGHYLTVGPNGLKAATFWKLEDVPPVDDKPKNASIEIKRLLENAVKSQLIGDVPVGIFLSGGIDSSAITAFASKHYPDKLDTFSAGFDFDRGVNELPAARFVADHFGTRHHEIRVSSSGLENIIRKLIRSHDEPFGDAANIPLYLLCEQLRGSVKVVLQGDGGDELFAGYRRYNVLAHEKLWRMAAKPLLALGLGSQRGGRFLGAVGQSDPAMRMALLLTVESLQSPPIRIISGQWRHNMDGHDPFSRYRELDKRFSALDPVQKMLFTDTSVILPDTFLEKVDKSTMAHGIEVRVPFLDAELANYVIGLPASLKVRTFQKKWILRKALRGIVPDKVLDAPKTGFGVPYEHWLREPLAPFMKSVLLDRKTRNQEVFDETELERAIAEHVSGKRNNGFLLWKALNLALWMEEYFV